MMKCFVVIGILISTMLANKETTRMEFITLPNSPILSIVKQGNDYLWVSRDENTLTEFSPAKNYYGTSVYLAHNTGSGIYFYGLKIGDEIQYSLGNKTTSYKVSHIYKFQALSPQNNKSDFIDLFDGKKYTSGELNKKMYDVKDGIVLQTCIENEKNMEWGRLFIFAKILED